MESFAYLLLLFEPKIFSSVLAVIVLISTVFYIKSGTGIMGVWEGGSFVIAVASPAFYLRFAGSVLTFMHQINV